MGKYEVGAAQCPLGRVMCSLAVCILTAHVRMAADRGIWARQTEVAHSVAAATEAGATTVVGGVPGLPRHLSQGAALLGLVVCAYWKANMATVCWQALTCGADIDLMTCQG